MGGVVETLRARLGTELGVSPWLRIDQARVNRFADVTDDHQWIHVDEARAAAGPFGGTIAHGYLTLALLPALSPAGWADIPGVIGVLNYGLDRVRFITPVRVGARVRNRVRMMSLDERGGGRVLVGNECTIEIEGAEKPALIAEALAMVLTEV